MKNMRKLRYLHVGDSPGETSISEREVTVVMDNLGNDLNYPMEEILKVLDVPENEESLVVDVSSDEFGQNILMILNKKHQEDVGGGYNFTLWRMLPIFGDCAFIEVGVVSKDESTMVDMNDDSLKRIANSLIKYKNLEQAKGMWLERVSEIKTKGKRRFIEDFNKKVEEEIKKIKEKQKEEGIDNGSDRASK